jgi:hypothetical protein
MNDGAALLGVVQHDNLLMTTRADGWVYFHHPNGYFGTDLCNYQNVDSVTS